MTRIICRYHSELDLCAGSMSQPNCQCPVLALCFVVFEVGGSLTKFRICDMTINLSANCNISMKTILTKRSNCTLEEVMSLLDDLCAKDCDPRPVSGHLSYKPKIKILTSNTTISAGDQEILASIQAFPPCDNITAVFTASSTSRNDTLVISKLGVQETSLNICNTLRKELVANMSVNLTEVGVPGTITIKAWNSVGCSEDHVMMEGTGTTALDTTTTTTTTTTTSPRPSILTTVDAANPNVWMIIGPIVACLVVIAVFLFIYKKCGKKRRDPSVNDQTPDQCRELLQQNNRG